MILRLFRLFRGDRSGMMDKSSVFYIFLYIFLHICCERGVKSNVAKELSGRGRTRSSEKGNQGVGDVRFINILQLNFFYLFFFNCFTLSFFSIPFLPTKFTHTHDPRPLPTTHAPRHLATLVSSHLLSKTVHSLRRSNVIRDGPLEKLWGGRGIFEPQEFFSLSNSLYEFFSGPCMNIS